MKDFGETFIVALVAALLLIALFRYMRSRLRQQSARFGLFQVRDKFVALAIEGKLSESHKVYQYYYKRINNSLLSVPVYGFDHALLTYITYKNRVDFEKKLEEERRTSNEILEAASELDPEVIDAIVDFYEANKHMLLAHSSSIRVLYIIATHGWMTFTPKRMLDFIRRVVGERLQMAVEFLLFADTEAGQFKQAVHNASSISKN